MGFDTQDIQNEPSGAIVYTQKVVETIVNVDVPNYIKKDFEIPVLVPKDYEVPILVEKRYEVPHVTHVDIKVEHEKPVYTIKNYEIPNLVPKDYEVPVIKEIEKIIEIPQVTTVEKLKIREVPIDVDKIVLKNKVVLNPILKDYVVEVAKIECTCPNCGTKMRMASV